MTLTEFLRDRIAEVEERCNALALPDGSWGDGFRRWIIPLVLAECEAKRRIMAAHPIAKSDTPGTHGFGCEVCGNGFDWGQLGNGYCDTLKALAMPSADHPDYDEAWRP